MNAIFQLMNPNNTVSINRPLAHAVGLNEAVVYGALISKFYYYSERGMLDSGWFFSTAPDLQESTALSEKQQKRCVDNLVKAGLVRCELRGMPAKRSFYIVEDIELIQALLAQGEAAMRDIKPAAAESYEKKRKAEVIESNENTIKMNDFLSAAFGANLPSGDNAASEIPHNSAISSCSDKRAEQAPPKGQSLLRQKVGASSAETAEQHFIKSKYNKTKNNQSIISAQGEISDDRIDRIDVVQERNIREKYKQIVRENIEYDCFAPEKQRELDELVELMVEVICSNKSTIRANGEELPQEVVKSQFLSLNESHIEYVLAALKKNKSDVRNIRSYLITALYNAPSTISSFWSAEVNHDLFGK